MRYLTHSETETYEFGRALGATLSAGDCVLLRGDLGAGKSVLARGIAGAHGITGAMPSPTFTILIPYEGTRKVYHFDLYRLSSPDEFYAAGLEEFIGGDGIAVIEWPEMAELSPEGAIEIVISRGTEDDDRVMEVSAPEKTRDAIRAWEARA